MRRVIIFLAATFFVLSACAREMRYSSDEIAAFPIDVQEHIKKGEVVPKMTPQHVRYAWGAPARIRVLEPSNNNKERLEWIYQSLGVFNTKLIFEDSKLVEIITNEPGVVK